MTDLGCNPLVDQYMASVRAVQNTEGLSPWAREDPLIDAAVLATLGWPWGVTFNMGDSYTLRRVERHCPLLTYPWDHFPAVVRHVTSADESACDRCETEDVQIAGWIVVPTPPHFIVLALCLDCEATLRPAIHLYDKESTHAEDQDRERGGGAHPPGCEVAVHPGDGRALGRQGILGAQGR
jgi:hypothetical protein